MDGGTWDLDGAVDADIDSMRRCPHGLDCGACAERLCVKMVAVADFPSEFGHFRIVGFVNNKDGKDHTAVVKGDLGDGRDVVVRIHSACLTGDGLGSRRCDWHSVLPQHPGHRPCAPGRSGKYGPGDPEQRRDRVRRRSRCRLVGDQLVQQCHRCDQPEHGYWR